MVETNEIVEIDLNHIGGNVINEGIPTMQKLDRRSSIDGHPTILGSYIQDIDHLKEGSMNSGTVKDVRTIDLTDDDDDDTSGNQNGNMEWKNETIFHFQQ